MPACQKGTPDIYKEMPKKILEVVKMIFKKKEYIDWEEFSNKESDAQFWGAINILARNQLGEVLS